MAEHEATGLSKDRLLELYRQLATIREFEERINVEVNAGRLASFYHLSSGQEANAVGVCAHLDNPADTIVSNHRGHGHCIARGADVQAMMKELCGSSEGLCKGRGGTMHIADIDRGILGANGVVGGGPPIAVGAALANKLRGDGGVSVVFLGDGAVNEGAVFEAMNMAVVLSVPTVFVIEDNKYGEFTTGAYMTGTDDLRARTEAFGFGVTEVDGTDLFAVHEAAGSVIDHARDGSGPAGLICHAPRFHGHFTGDPEDYRPKGEAADAREGADCIKIFRSRVLATGQLTTDDLATVDGAVAEIIDAAVAAAAAAPRPDPVDVAADVYVSY